MVSDQDHDQDGDRCLVKSMTFALNPLGSGCRTVDQVKVNDTLEVAPSTGSRDSPRSRLAW